MSHLEEKEAEIVKFPGIASISLSITPLKIVENVDLLEAIVRVYDENNEQIMRQKSRSLHTIAKNLKLFIQTRTNLPINDRRMSTWFAEYLSKVGIKIDEEEAYQIIKKASQALEQVSRVKIELVEPSDLVSIETDVLAKQISLRFDHLMSEDELYDLLEKHQTPLNNKVQRTISYVNSGGVEHKDNLSLVIESSENIFEKTLIASFKNDTEKELTKIIISDIIPYAYKIIDISKETGKYTKELQNDGLKITWKIDKVAPGKEIKTVYTFEHRIPRTIYIRKGEEIRIVQDYNSIITEENEEGKIVKYFISEVINLLPVTIDELIVRDLLPPEIILNENSILEDMKFIDFGQILGSNIQVSQINVETGTKILQKYEIGNAPIVWKLDHKFELEENETAYITKIFEQTPSKTSFICTIIAYAPIPYKLINEIESGLDIQEFLPTTLVPEGSKKLTWETEGKFTISMLLKGNLNRPPNPPKMVINGSEYSSNSQDFGVIRSSKILSIPFNHVALYRKVSREY
ncbi:MAG: hypothetical protein ACFFDW_02080 [Candidatus Thorarchaeota archaeon]